MSAILRIGAADGVGSERQDFRPAATFTAAICNARLTSNRFAHSTRASPRLAGASSWP